MNSKYEYIRNVSEYDKHQIQPQFIDFMQIFTAFSELTRPKRLWLLRFILAVLTFLVRFALGVYVVLSLYNLIASDSKWAGFILGAAGLSIVWGCLSVLVIIELFSLFIHIHDNVDDIRNKTIDPEFQIDPVKDRANREERAAGALAMIILIIVAVILSFANMNKKAKSAEEIAQERTEAEARRDEVRQQRREREEQKEQEKMERISSLNSLRPSQSEVDREFIAPAAIPQEFQ